MTAQFAQSCPETQKLLLARVRDTHEWKLFLESMPGASVRGHKSSATGNHLDVRVNWGGRSRCLHIDSRHFDGPLIAQFVVGALLIEAMPGSKVLIERCADEAKAQGKYEFSFDRGIMVAEVVFREAEARGISFCHELVEYAERIRHAPLDAKRERAMRAALGEAKKHIRIALSNGLSPDDIVDFVNECVVAEVLSQ